MKEQVVNKIFEDLKNRGSNISQTEGENLKEEFLKLEKKDIGLKEIALNISKNIKDLTEEFLSKKNKFDVNYVSGISSCIYFPSFNGNGEIKLKFIGGNRSRYRDLIVDENTLFDVASITKLYTLILAFEFERLGLISLDDKISDLNSDYKNLNDFTFNDLIRLCGELRTDGNVATASSQEEAYRILKTMFLASDDRSVNKYTDFGAIVIGETLSKVVKNTYLEDLSYEELINMFIIEPLGLSNTMFNPQLKGFYNITGNNGLAVHDRKARVLGGAIGSAGLFTTSEDLSRLAKAMFSVKYLNPNFLNKKYLGRFGEITFPDSPSSNKGNLGIYVKHPLGFVKTYTPSEFSTGSFSHQGWTGSLATFDPNNLIHQNILVNSIYESDNKDEIRNDKPIGFGGAFDEYLKELTKQTMLLYLAKRYYNSYCNDKSDIDNIERTR